MGKLILLSNQQLSSFPFMRETPLWKCPTFSHSNTQEPTQLHVSQVLPKWRPKNTSMQNTVSHRWLISSEYENNKKICIYLFILWSLSYTVLTLTVVLVNKSIIFVSYCKLSFFFCLYICLLIYFSVCMSVFSLEHLYPYLSFTSVLWIVCPCYNIYKI